MNKIIKLLLGFCFLFSLQGVAQRKHDAGKVGALASANSIKGRIELKREMRIKKRMARHQADVIAEGNKKAKKALGGKLHKRHERKKRGKAKEEPASKS